MTAVPCCRCGQSAQGLDRAPLPGAVGELVRSKVCARCWGDWLALQVKIINEYRLSPVEPDHYEFLVEQMKLFLKIEEGAAG
jgi:Fe-S cluster biosynthesis and repair protein YggX